MVIRMRREGKERRSGRRRPLKPGVTKKAKRWMQAMSALALLAALANDRL